MRPWAWELVGIVLVPLLAACSLDPGFFPKGGPHGNAILEQAASSGTTPGGVRASVPYLLVEPSPQLIEALTASDVSFAAFPPGPRRATIGRIGVGDLVGVTIFEARPGGLFIREGSVIAGNANSVDMPPQPVDTAGDITVPYAGKIHVAGRSVADVQREIENRLKDRAIEPQVIVTVRENRSNLVSVLGQVNAAGQFALAVSGMQILDAIARAGGTRFPGYEMNITLQRGGRQITVPFDGLVVHPESNIALLPGDVVYASRYIRSFVALGASGRNERLEFDAPTLSMVDALGKSAGLQDARANPAGVFIYRLEKREILERLGYPVDRFVGTMIPTIYSIDLSVPAGVFLAGQFKMRSGDVLYVANSASVEATKFFTLLSSISQVATDAAGIYGVAKGNAVVTSGAAVVGTAAQ